METARKITVEVPRELLEKAQRATGSGITQTVRTGLQLVAASQAYARVRQLRGKVRFTRTFAELKPTDDRGDTSTCIGFRQGAARRASAMHYARPRLPYLRRRRRPRSHHWVRSGLKRYPSKLRTSSTCPPIKANWPGRPRPDFQL